MEKQLIIPNYLSDIVYPKNTITTKGLFILNNIKEELPHLYEYIMSNKKK